VTATPWGDARELRASSPEPTSSSRERIYAAMVTTVAERGYGATQLADVLELAGVSRGAFDELFDDQLDCFVQTIEALLALAEQEMAARLGDRQEPWDARLRRSFDALIDLIVAQPAAARICLVEAYIAGPDAVACVDRMARAAGRQALAVLEQSPERAGMPPDIARAVLGGLRKVVQTRLYTGREHELPQVASELMDWALGYRTPPVALRPAQPPPAAPRPAPRDGPDPGQKVIEAVIEVVAERGYRNTTIRDIAGAASISDTAFQQRFDDKPSAYLAGLDEVSGRVLELALSGYRQAESWPHGVRHGLAAVLSHLSREPQAARFAAEAVWGGPELMRRLDEETLRFRAMLAEGLKTRSSASGLLAEAIGSSLLALVYSATVNGDPARLYELTPTALFIPLAPSVGSIEACAVINGD
jgi:AcrR family transcriptional regulator